MSKIYKGLIRVLDKFVPKAVEPLWKHPAGPKTIFFWAPLFKWGLVLAGLGDSLDRPAEKLSVPQCTSLFVTGAVWSRFSVVIIPKNYNLLSVNAFVSLVNLYQLIRVYKYRRSLSAVPPKK